MLRKVLNTAAFKAQDGKIPSAKILSNVPGKEDVAMEDVGTGGHAKDSLHRQLFNLKSPLRATDPNVRLGTSTKTKDPEDNQMTKVEIDDVDMRGLEIMDRQP